MIMEIQRYANIAPMGLPHMTRRDLTVNGVTIPANTFVLPLMAEIMKGSYWEDGEMFRPERFINKNGEPKRDEHFIPFMTGR